MDAQVICTANTCMLIVNTMSIITGSIGIHIIQSDQYVPRYCIDSQLRDEWSHFWSYPEYVASRTAGHPWRLSHVYVIKPKLMVVSYNLS